MTKQLLRRWVDNAGNMVVEYWDDSDGKIYTKSCECVDLRT